jgi:hypothetical protein
MKKLSKHMLFLLLLPIILLPTFISTARVKADLAFLAWGGLNPNGPAPAGEYGTESWVCHEVCYNIVPSQYFSIRGDNYDNYTDQFWVNFCLNYLEPNQIWTVVLWVGDFCWDNTTIDGYYHYGFYPSQYIIPGPQDPVEKVWDYKVFYNTTYPYGYSFQYNIFDWTCACAGLYYDTTSGNPPYTPYFPTTTYNPNNAYGWAGSAPENRIGMPYAWTGSLGLSTDGYNSPDQTIYCYIGWQNASPYLSQMAPYSYSYNVNIPYYYYAFAMGKIDGSTHNAHDSLDYAASTVYGTDFGSSLYNYGWQNSWGFWSKMQVLGDSVA